MGFWQPIPLEISENPPDWPKENFRIVFVCPSCGHGYEYLAPNVRWRQFPTPGPNQPQSSTICVYCEYQCAHKNCAIKARHYTLVEGDRKSTRLNSSHLGISYAV